MLLAAVEVNGELHQLVETKAAVLQGVGGIHGQALAAVHGDG